MTLQLKGVSFQFDKNCDYLFQDIDLSIYPGELIMLKGDSGIGKSTLCRVICGVIPQVMKGIVQGNITFRNQSIQEMSLSQVSKYLGVVFQDPETQLFMPTVIDEIAFGLENLAIESNEILEIVETLIKTNELESIKYKNPKLCSGGEKQVIVFSSVVAMNRPFLLLDEAFSQVDEHKCELIRTELISLKKQKKGILLIDHRSTYDDIADNIYQLEEGKLNNIGCVMDGNTIR